MEDDVDDLQRETQGCLGGEISNREARMLVGGLKSVYNEHVSGFQCYNKLRIILGCFQCCVYSVLLHYNTIIIFNVL